MSDSARIAVIPGDGIGIEVIFEASRILHTAVELSQRPIELVEFDWGDDRFLRDGTTLPAGAVEMLKNEFNAILFGAIGDPRVPSNQHAAEILLGLRAKLDLYANVRPVELLDSALTPLKDRAEPDVRFVIVRDIPRGCTPASADSSSGALRMKSRCKRM